MKIYVAPVIVLSVFLSGPTFSAPASAPLRCHDLATNTNVVSFECRSPANGRHDEQLLCVEYDSAGQTYFVQNYDVPEYQKRGIGGEREAFEASSVKATKYTFSGEETDSEKNAYYKDYYRFALEISNPVGIKLVGRLEYRKYVKFRSRREPATDVTHNYDYACVRGVLD